MEIAQSFPTSEIVTSLRSIKQTGNQLKGRKYPKTIKNSIAKKQTN